MSKLCRIITVIIFLSIAVMPVSNAHAATVPCDNALFMATIATATQGTQLTPPPSPHWQLIDPPYITDFWRKSGKFLTLTVQIKRGNKIIGTATQTNAAPPIWSSCHPGNGWKNYLLAHA